jgi:glyoxylase-like metal-dependent hydrolase (beta-lactamase superfamily II)
VRYPGGNVVVDPVPAGDEVLAALAELGAARIVLTNRNHVRASATLRQRLGARVAIHPADRAYAESQGAVVDDELEVGDRVGPFVVLDASGKSPGEVALHWPERRLLIVGDACVGKPAGECALLGDKVIQDKARLEGSLARLAREVDCDALLLSDGAPIPEGGRAALERLVATFTA